jgi:parvulin-like peptidyl-prolyl isomerase
LRRRRGIEFGPRKWRGIEKGRNRMNATTELNPVLAQLQSHWLSMPAYRMNMAGRGRVSELGWSADLFADDESDAAQPAAPRGPDWGAVWTGGRDAAEPEAGGFQSPDVFEAAHIFLRADAADTAATGLALARAEAILAILERRPEQFGELARAVSQCPSAVNGGRLGGVLAGDVTTEFARIMRALIPGQICPVAVRTRYGVHVIRLDDRIPGRALPSEPAQDGLRATIGRTTPRGATMARDTTTARTAAGRPA